MKLLLAVFSFETKKLTKECERFSQENTLHINFHIQFILSFLDINDIKNIIP